MKKYVMRFIFAWESEVFWKAQSQWRKAVLVKAKAHWENLVFYQKYVSFLGLLRYSRSESTGQTQCSIAK